MKSITILSSILLSGLLLSCDQSDYNYIKTRDQAYHPEKEGGTSLLDTANNGQSTHLYLTAVEFEDGYDWRKDREFGDVECRVVVYRDGLRYLSLPAGKGTCILPDHDMHHIVNGHLFSEYSTGETTIIKMDGSDFINYEGDEFLKGIIIKNNSLFTLGQSRKGYGFSLRQMGNAIFQRSDGRIVGGLFEDEDRLCFTYLSSSVSSSGRSGEWHIVCDGEDSIVPLPQGMYEIMDVRRVDGKLCIVGKSNSLGNPVLYVDGRKYDLSGGGSILAKNLRITVDDTIYIEGNITRLGYSGVHSIIWRENSVLSELSIPDAYFLRKTKGLSYMARDNTGKLTAYSNIFGTIAVNIESYFFPGRSAVDIDGDLFFVTTPKDPGNYPGLWRNGIETKFEFNGYFTSVSVSN